VLACDVNNGGQIFFGLRDNNPNRPDLINRRIGRVARPTERIEMYFAREFPPEMLGQIATPHRAVDHGRQKNAAGWRSVHGHQSVRLTTYCARAGLVAPDWHLVGRDLVFCLALFLE